MTFVARATHGTTHRTAHRTAVRSTVSSAYLLSGYGKTSVKENDRMRAVGLSDVRFVDAPTIGVLLHTLDRRVWVLRRNCCLNLCRCIAAEHLFSRTVHVVAT